MPKNKFLKQKIEIKIKKYISNVLFNFLKNKKYHRISDHQYSQVTRF
jgi:hypothetical protein